MNLGEMIKQFRSENNLSQRKFAEISGLSNGYISMVEHNKNPKTGEPILLSIQSLKCIAKAMGISLNALVASVDDIPIDISINTLPTSENTEISLSDEATEIAVIYDTLTPSGQELVQSVVDFASKYHSRS